MPGMKLGNILVILPNFQKCTCCEKYLKDNEHSSLHLSREYARIIVLGQYLFLKAHSFLLATPSENRLLLGTDDVRGEISTHSFGTKGGFCLYMVM